MIVACAVLCAVCFPPASADTVKLRNGRTIDGIAREDGKQVAVEVAAGTLFFHVDDVESIKKEATKLHEYLDKYQTVKGSDNRDELYGFVVWAEGAGIVRDRDRLLRRVIEIDPEHEGARKRLGYHRHDGKWLTAAELMKAKGFVRYEGRWVTEAERELAEGKKKESKLKSEIARLQDEERRRTEREAREELQRRVLQEWWILQQMALSRGYERRYREIHAEFPWWQAYEPYSSYALGYGAYNPYLYPWSYSSGTTVTPTRTVTPGAIETGGTGGRKSLK